MSCTCAKSIGQQAAPAWLAIVRWRIGSASADAFESAEMVEECNVQELHIAGLHGAIVEGRPDPQDTGCGWTAVATTKAFLAVQSAGSRPVNRGLQSFDLAAILTIGYRGSSLRGTQVYRWATRILREHLLPHPTSREHRGLRTDAFIKVTA